MNNLKPEDFFAAHSGEEALAFLKEYYGEEIFYDRKEFIKELAITKIEIGIAMVEVINEQS